MCAVDRSMVLHALLHVQADLGGGQRTLSIPVLVEVGDALRARAGLQVGLGVPRGGDLRDAVGAGAPEHHDVQQAVGAEAVGPVHGGAGGLARREQPGHDAVRVLRRRRQHLAEVVGGDAAHVVVHGGQHGDGLARHVHPREDGRRLADARQPLGQQLGGQVVQVQVDVVRLLAHPAALADLHGHGAADDVAAGQVLRRGRVPLHEPLTLGVAQDAALPTGALRDQAAGAVDARGVELHELVVLHRQPRAQGHRVAVPGAGVGAGAAEVGPPVAPRGQHRVLRPQAMQRAVLHAHGGHAHAGPVLHHQVQGEVLDEVGGVEGQRAPVQRVQHRVARAVRGARAAVGLAALAEVQALAAERALVDLALLRAAEGQPELLQLQHRLGRLAAHVVDGVLVAQPVAALDRVVHVPPPVVLGHVRQRGVDAALGRHRVRPGGEELGDAGGLEPGLGQAHGRAQAGAARAHHHRVVGVVHYCVFGCDICVYFGRSSRSNNTLQLLTTVKLTLPQLQGRLKCIPLSSASAQHLIFAHE
mmetsp:Transcript_3468/g.4859  ORF Transcript_3468/g.4859 Transcript_3468/m.4859 type:complete len:531 (-) Transcript_3468:80-1672(-)